MQLLARIGLIIFLISAAVEHLVVARLDPATHEISEYAHGRFGPLMIGGFAAWSFSLAATSGILRLGPRGRLLAGLLAVAAVGMAVTAVFPTQTSAGRLPPGVALTTAGRLHDLGSGATSVALFAAALVSIWAFSTLWPLRHRIAAVLVLAVSADVALLAAGPDVAGIRQRLLVLTGCAWQAMILNAMRATGCNGYEGPRVSGNTRP